MLAGLIDADALSAALDKFLPDDVSLNPRPRRSGSRQRSVSVAVSDLSEPTPRRSLSAKSQDEDGGDAISGKQQLGPGGGRKKELKKPEVAARSTLPSPRPVSAVAAATRRAVESLQTPSAPIVPVPETVAVANAPRRSSVSDDKHVVAAKDSKKASDKQEPLSAALQQHLLAHNIPLQPFTPLSTNKKSSADKPAASARVQVNSSTTANGQVQPIERSAQESKRTHSLPDARPSRDVAATNVPASAVASADDRPTDETVGGEDATMIWGDDDSVRCERVPLLCEERTKSPKRPHEAKNVPATQDEPPGEVDHTAPTVETQSRTLPASVSPSMEDAAGSTAQSNIAKLLIARNARLRVVTGSAGSSSRSRSRSPSAAVAHETPSQPVSNGIRSDMQFSPPPLMPVGFQRRDEASQLLVIATVQHCLQLRQCVQRSPTNRIIAGVMSSGGLPELCQRVRSTFSPDSMYLVRDVWEMASDRSDREGMRAGSSAPTQKLPGVYFDVDGKMVLAAAVAPSPASGGDERMARLFWRAAIECHRLGFDLDAAAAIDRSGPSRSPFLECTWLDLTGGSMFGDFADAFANCDFPGSGVGSLDQGSEEAEPFSISYYSVLSNSRRHALEPLIAPPPLTLHDLAHDGREARLPPLCWFSTVIEATVCLAPTTGKERSDYRESSPVDACIGTLKLKISRHTPRIFVFEASCGQAGDARGGRRFDRRLVLAHGHILQHVGAVDGAVVDVHSRSVGLAIPQVAQNVADSWIQCRGGLDRRGHGSAGAFERLVFDALAIAQQRRWQRVGVVVVDRVLDDEFDAAVDALLQWQFPYPRVLVAFHGDARCFPQNVVMSAFEEVSDMRHALQNL